MLEKRRKPGNCYTPHPQIEARRGSSPRPSASGVAWQGHHCGSFVYIIRRRFLAYGLGAGTRGKPYAGTGRAGRGDRRLERSARPEPGRAERHTAIAGAHARAAAGAGHAIPSRHPGPPARPHVGPCDPGRRPGGQPAPRRSGRASSPSTRSRRRRRDGSSTSMPRTSAISPRPRHPRPEPWRTGCTST
jgi:hypothetical protein